MYRLLILFCISSFLACKSNSQNGEQLEAKTFEIVKASDEWKAELNDFEYYVIREKGTERPFTSELLDNKAEGVYICKACDLPLFDAKSKFKSGTGWPSFYQALNDKNIYTETDYHIGYPRTEIMCNRCGGHLGHVFKDGPEPTGLRYCVNGVSLKFEERP